MMKHIKSIQFDLYLLLLLILTFFSYIGLLGIFIIPIFLIIAIGLIWYRADVIFLIPLGLFVQMTTIEISEDFGFATFFSFSATGLLILDFIRNRKFTKFGKLFKPLAIFAILSIITAINMVDLYSLFQGFGRITSILVFYVYFVNTLNKDKVTITNISKILIYLSILVTLEILHFVFTSDLEIIELIDSRDWNLSWGNLNVIIFSNLVSLPLVGYLIIKSRIKIFYMLYSLIIVSGIFITFSRSSVICVVFYIAFLAPMVFILEKSRFNLILQSILFGLIILGLSFYVDLRFLYSTLLENFTIRGLSTYFSRLDLIKIGLEKLKEFPLFGSGGLYSSRYFLVENESSNYHNFIIQASTLGIFGVINLFYLFYLKVKVIQESKDIFKYFALLMIVVTMLVNGMFQPMYFHSTYMTYIFLVLAGIEVVKG